MLLRYVSFTGYFLVNRWAMKFQNEFNRPHFPWEQFKEVSRDEQDSVVVVEYVHDQLPVGYVEYSNPYDDQSPRIIFTAANQGRLVRASNDNPNPVRQLLQ